MARPSLTGTGNFLAVLISVNLCRTSFLVNQGWNREADSGSHSPVADADVIYQAGPETAALKTLAGTNVQPAR
jgi:hypothetical protein